MFRILIASCLSVLVFTGAGCDNDKGVEAKPTIASAIITLRFSGPRYAGSFYPVFFPATDHAVWIEDAEGQYVKTLGISKSVVSVAQYSHVDHLPTWMAKSGTTYEVLQAETEEGVAPSFDAVSGASVYFVGDVTDSTLGFLWDLKDGEGNHVLEANFRFCAEVANITKDEATSYQINSETTCGLMDLKEQSTTLADPTQHILELSAEYGYAK
jgi:hypothetical protein